MGKRLVDRVVVLTGATGGLGRAYASRLADEGADLMLTDIDHDSAGAAALEDMVRDLNTRGAAAISHAGDITDPATAEAVISRAVARFGRVHAVINNAGNWYEAPLADSDVDQWDAIMNTHVRGTFLMMRAAARHWRDAFERDRGGRPVIVNTTSRSALNVIEHHGAYAAAKSAVTGLSLVAAKEFEAFGVRVNCIAPAARTPMLRQIPKMVSILDAPVAEGAFDSWDPDNVAQLVAYLVTADCPLNGRILFCSGGVVQEYSWTQPLEEHRKERAWSIAELADELPALLSPDC